MLMRVTDYEEYRFLEDFSKLGGLYTFFPTGNDAGAEVSPAFTYNDIWLVQSDADWRAIPWGMNAKQQISTRLMESAYVPTS